MRVIGVVDLAGGRAVHARGGRRERYAPVQRVAGSPIEPGSAMALARAYTDRLGLTGLYVADLDAIAGRSPQESLIASLPAPGVPLWVDAGISSADRARRLIQAGATTVVVGLETLPSWGALAAICEAVGGDRVAFSLDLRAGRPVIAEGFEGAPDEPARVLAARAARAGVGSVLLIDLARVGGGTGPDFQAIADVRAALTGVELLAGGGIRGAQDLARLSDAGCDGVLVATALQDGRLGAAEIAAAERYRSRAALSGPPTRG